MKGESLDDLAIRINNLRRMEQMADRPSVSFDPSDGMETVSELKEYVRFLFKHLQEKDAFLQEKDAIIKEMAADLKALRKKDDDYQKLLEQIVRQNEEMHQKVSEINRLNQLVVKLSEQLALQQKHRFAGRSQKNKKSSTTQSQEENTSDRQKDKDDFDGNGSSATKDDMVTDTDGAAKEEKHTTGVDEFRKGSKYNTMAADEVYVHESDETQIPQGCTFLFKRIRRSFEQVQKIIQHDYQIVVYLDKDGRMHEAYLPAEGQPEYIDKFPGTHASASYMAHLGFAKYVMCTPFFREMHRIVAAKMNTCRQTLVNWTRKGAQYLNKLTEHFKDLLFSEDGIINCDETWERVVLKQSKKGYMWCFVNRISKVVMFHYDKGSRSRATLKEFIGDRKITALQSDGYNVYMYLDDEVVNTEHLCCMAHARAKFHAALEQGKDQRAEYILYLMGQLYHLEAEIKGKSAQEIFLARNSERARQIKEKLIAQVNKLLAEEIGQSDTLMGKAIRYFKKFETQLFAYMKDGRYTIDNLISERAIRSFTVERNNAPTFCSHKGVEVSALYHTVIETCKLQGYSVLEYLEAFFTAVIKGRTDYENLMPATIGIGKAK